MLDCLSLLSCWSGLFVYLLGSFVCCGFVRFVDGSNSSRLSFEEIHGFSVALRFVDLLLVVL